MKKGFKKFLGVAIVSGISASASAIGSNYCGANAVYAAKPPERTDEEVAWMNSQVKYWSILKKVWKTEPSQWSDDIFRRLVKADSDSVPGMTDKEVAWMDSEAKYWFILEEVWKTEPSQWSDDIFRRLAKANSDVVKAESDLVSRIYWRENFSRKESWRRAEATKREVIDEMYSNPEKFDLFRNWADKIVY